ncbi:glycosyltransferase family 1 protein [Xanthomonas rydalmerensis]|uniref:Glycosyltransferase family 1 protein n=1 Tax=Xanthomonas rydalmerensis TaxID=3046274 RepID=A0ABZ0JM32_9XANT|nr:glycosyltransferase family 1 protein [Xanthomonas sp. DM-2023]WOS40453.1 glycosyltransferase family 1 protein [Xanthomonas sp. DM-2023]WOS44637.1 glycosyltransferase family 1 protein [Xanthomonas sp. DM-2023]WOS48817.1 glycosyltransferase family 1 protein [Xanthomonas sp. DM-2023]WOS52997.1 glycosyltransferase family 1 protein [Xanthomonas sp. DM-2023]WOS57181.1 glycosyltransferase family 1 protein [Xanthomonas sp. DM-2023]
MHVILATESIRYPLTGVGRYTQELATQLAALPQIDSLRFLHGRRLRNDLPAPGPAPTLVPWLRDRLSGIQPAVDIYRRINNAAKARALRGQAPALFHGCNYYLPAFDGPCVATFHDVSIYRWAECHRADRVRYMRKELALSLRRAQLILTVSEFSRREIAAQFDWPLARIRAIPLAGNAAFRPHRTEELQPPLQALGLQADGYSLFLGTIEPRKNLQTLLQAYAALPTALRTRWPLVVAGHPGWHSEALHQRMAQAQRDGWLRYLGYVEEASLPALVAGARLFVFPSLYEGFGLPVLEAMGSGTPVLCSNAAALPEVAGDAAALFDPGDVDGLVGLLARGLDDAAWRATLSAAGRRRAAEFDWRTCAERTVDAYRDAMRA